MHIYSIQSDNKIKIGVSNNPEERLKQLQTGNPNILSLHYISEKLSEHEAYKLEKIIHKNLKFSKVSGEWFNIDPETAKLEIMFSLIRYGS